MKNKIKQHVPIILILIAAAFLYTWKIWGDGFANSYYAAGVYSMGQNFHAFFFNSLDSAGFVTIDKPPLGFWIQVLFTKVFGFSGGVLVLPEAICGVLSVYVIYAIVKKRFGKAAGLVSAAVLALTPIFAAVSRNNTIDGILILVLLLAADQAIKAAEKSSMKYLIFSGILIGLGFNVKMLQAFMIVPAVYITYLVFSKQKLLKKILACAVSAVILLAISLSWIAVVDLTDEDSRPYIGSSDTNSALELALGYNGINRLLGRRNTLTDDGTNQMPPNAQDGNMPADGDRRAPGALQGDAQRRPPQRQAPPNAQYAPNRSAGPVGEAGESSVLRLFREENAGQASWLLLPAMAMALAAAVLVFMKRYRTQKGFTAFFFFAMVMIPMFIYFSIAEGVTHRYYFAMMGPPIAALIGIGYHYLAKMKKRWVLPSVFAAAAAVQIYIQLLYKGWADWAVPVMAVIFAASLIAIAVMSVKKMDAKKIAPIMCVLLLLPALWSATPAIYSDNSQLPISGPELVRQNDSFDNTTDFSLLIDYLKEHRDGAKYLVMAESSMQSGAELILQSGEAVMVLGGFNGGDEVLTLEEFIEAVDSGKVRYALIGGNNAQGGNSQIYQWIKNNAEEVPVGEYGSRMRNMILYRLG